MAGKESTLHLEGECTWRWWIPNMTRGVHHFLGYPDYVWMPTDLCFYVVSTPGWVLEMTALIQRILCLIFLRIFTQALIFKFWGYEKGDWMKNFVL